MDWSTFLTWIAQFAIAGAVLVVVAIVLAAAYTAARDRSER